MKAMVNHEIILDLYKAGYSKSEIINMAIGQRCRETRPPLAINLTAISKTSVYRVLANNGFAGVKNPPISAEMEQEILDLYLSGFGSKLICDRLNIKKSRSNLVYKILAKHNIDVRQGKNAKHNLLHLVPKIIDLYEQGQGCTTIANSLGISKSTATKYIKKYCKVRDKKRPPIRSRRERDKLFMSEMDYFNRVSYCEWRDSDRRIPLEEFKQSAYIAALRAAELYERKASFRKARFG